MSSQTMVDPMLIFWYMIGWLNDLPSLEKGIHMKLLLLNMRPTIPFPRSIIWWTAFKVTL